MSVRQRRKNDCTIAAVANALGLSYNRVKTACGPVGKGLFSHEISWLLSKLDADWQLTRVRKSYPLERFVELRPKGRYVVSYVADIFMGDRHAVAVVDGVIHGEHTLHSPVVEYWKIG